MQTKEYTYCKNMLCYAKSLQLCPTLCNPIDGSPPGSPVPGILQATTLERVAISFSNAWKWKMKGKLLSRVWALAWTAAHQAPPSMGFSRQEYWSGVPLQECLRKTLPYNFVFLSFLPSCTTPLFFVWLFILTSKLSLEENRIGWYLGLRVFEMERGRIKSTF